MNQKLKVQLDRAFKLTRDLVAHLDESALALDLPRLPSNRMAGQFWCIAGARESFTAAIKAGQWQGFSCSLEAPQLKESVIEVMDKSHQCLDEIDFADLSEAQVHLAFDLLEHEVQHHGQLIRFVYGNGLSFPGSWHQRYTV